VPSILSNEITPNCTSLFEVVGPRSGRLWDYRCRHNCAEMVVTEQNYLAELLALCLVLRLEPAYD
jgi:hypothetical protein